MTLYMYMYVICEQLSLYQDPGWQHYHAANSALAR